MKGIFGEFYRPSRGDLEKFATHATVVLDANVLLGLYRLGTSERDQVFEVLEKIKERLWLPYQVGLEYQRARLDVVSAQAGKYESAKVIHGTRSQQQMEDKLDGLNLPAEVRKEVGPLLPELVAKLRSAVADFEAHLEELATRHVVSVAQATSNDPVRNRLDDLFAQRVGVKPEQKIHAERVKEGLRRVASKIPPGYKDAAAKDSDEHKAGDYLLWAQILDYAAESDRPLLLVTNDQKEDWFERVAGEVTGPRVELVADFAAANTHGYHQVTLAGFLELSNEFLHTSVDHNTIERASEFDALGADPLTIFRAAVLAAQIDPLADVRKALLAQTDPLAGLRAAMAAQIDPLADVRKALLAQDVSEAQDLREEAKEEDRPDTWRENDTDAGPDVPTA